MPMADNASPLIETCTGCGALIDVSDAEALERECNSSGDRD